MAFKIVAGVFALALLLVYLGAIAVKLKDLPLYIVALIGFAMVVVDFVQSLKEKD